ncbi:MAG TPA: glycosyltransferase, partial [Vicinamibacterales bacterium]|nr:glycosyltransferase [Vicinamibacterales bacterium]
MPGIGTTACPAREPAAGAPGAALSACRAPIARERPAGDGRPIRVGFVLHVMQVAGAEMLVADIIRLLGPRIEPTIFCLDAVGALGERLRDDGVPVVTLGRTPGIDLRVAVRLGREIRARRIEVVHAHQYTPFFYAALARAGAGRPVHVMFTEHGRHYPDVVSWRRRLVNRLLLSRCADEVTGVCRFSAVSLARVDGFGAQRPIEVIANGVEPSRYAGGADRDALRRSLGLDPARRYLISVARFHPVKDHATLLRAFARIAVAQPEVDLLLAGDGPLRGTLETQAGALGIADRVRFLGVRDDVPSLLRAADLFVMTSLSEAASITVLEAMASGLPVIVTAVGGNVEIVRQGIDGMLVPRQDVGALVGAMHEMLRDPVHARA